MTFGLSACLVLLPPSPNPQPEKQNQVVGKSTKYQDTV